MVYGFKYAMFLKGLGQCFDKSLGKPNRTAEPTVAAAEPTVAAAPTGALASTSWGDASHAPDLTSDAWGLLP